MAGVQPATNAQPAAAATASAAAPGASPSPAAAKAAADARPAAKGKAKKSDAKKSDAKKPKARKRKGAGGDAGGDVVDEKRIRFLERNRAAATRCRERKKQWMQELQQRANTLSVANAQMHSELDRLRDEVAQLKNMLMHQGGEAALEGLPPTN